MWVKIVTICALFFLGTSRVKFRQEPSTFSVWNVWPELQSCNIFDKYHVCVRDGMVGSQHWHYPLQGIWCAAKVFQNVLIVGWSSKSFPKCTDSWLILQKLVKVCVRKRRRGQTNSSTCQAKRYLARKTFTNALNEKGKWEQHKSQHYFINLDNLASIFLTLVVLVIFVAYKTCERAAFAMFGKNNRFFGKGVKTKRGLGTPSKTT